MAKFLEDEKTSQRMKLEERKRKNDEQKARKDEYVTYMR